MKNYHEVEQKDNMKIKESTEEEASVKTERPRPKRIVTEPLVKPKRGLFSRLGRVIMGPEGGRRIGEYIREDIVLPAFKNIIADSITSGINMALFGDSKPSSSRGTGGSRYTTPRTDYRSRFTTPAPARTTHEPAAHRRNSQYAEEFNIPDRDQAILILENLRETADNYDTVPVADYYDMVGFDTKFTDHNYGWSFDAIARATVIPVRGGYILKLPPLEAL